MPILALHQIPPNEKIQADICIVGSGPAGTTLAIELAKTSLRVVMVESGGLERSSKTDELDEIESIGWPRVEDQWTVRNRTLGGSSATWRGKCAPFDDIDYEQREWVPYSGWPLRPADMAPYLERSAPHLGIGVGTGYTGMGFWEIANLKKQTPAFDERLLHPFFWQFTKDKHNPFDYMRFAKRLIDGEAGDATILMHATVTDISVNEDGAKTIELRGNDNTVRTVVAPVAVICAGGIENAKILLASRRQFAAGLGNQNDLVGRFLMDHPRGPVATFDPKTSASLLDWFGLYNVKSQAGSHRFRHGLQLSPDYQRTNRLLNCTVFLEEKLTEDDPWSALIRLLRRQGSFADDVKHIFSNAGLVASGLYQYFIRKRGLPRKFAQLDLLAIVEQTPDPESRITLAEKTDRFGTPLARINWKMNELEQNTVITTARLVAAEFDRLGQTPPLLKDWVRDGRGFPDDIRDVAHPTGTTRMAADPRSGVVDINCEVHGVHGLFVCGSSVFPTAGHANPTQMIVAIAIRLADTLRKRLV